MSSENPPQEARPLIPLEPVGDDKEYREGLEAQGIIIAADVLCPICGLEAPKEGVHEICILKQIVETNKKVIESNTSLEATIARLTTSLEAASQKPMMVPQFNVKELVSQIMKGFPMEVVELSPEVVPPKDKPLTLMQRRAQRISARRGRR